MWSRLTISGTGPSGGFLSELIAMAMPWRSIRSGGVIGRPCGLAWAALSPLHARGFAPGGWSPWGVSGWGVVSTSAVGAPPRDPGEVGWGPFVPHLAYLAMSVPAVPAPTGSSGTKVSNAYLLAPFTPS